LASRAGQSRPSKRENTLTCDASSRKPL